MKPFDVRENILRMITVLGFLFLLLLTGDVLVMGGDRIRPENVDAGGVVGIGEPVPDTASDPKSSNWPRVAGWTMTEVVTDESSHASYHPSVAVGPDGAIHVAWTEYTHEWPATDDYAIFYRKRTGEGVWSEVEYVSTESYAAAWDPSLAVDAQGTVHIAWEDHTYDYGNDRSDIFYKKKPEGGEWTPTEIVTIETDMSSGYPVLAAEANGTVHLVWCDKADTVSSGDDWDVFYRMKPADGEWSDTELVSSESENNSYMTSMDVEYDGTVHVSWTDLPLGGESTVNYKKKPADGNWTPVEVIDSGASPFILWESSLCVDGEATVHIVWLGNGLLYKKKPAGGDWSAAEDIRIEGYGYYTPSIGADQENTVHVIFVAYPFDDNPPNIFHRKKRNTGDWTSPELVSSESSMRLIPEDLDVSVEQDGTVHAVWYDNTDYDGAGMDVDIFYKQKNPTPHAAENENLNTIIVPDDYPTIQEAVDHAVDGMMVYVRRGTYEEKIDVTKQIELIGENIDSTIVDGGGGYGDAIELLADSILVSGFTVQNSGWHNPGIMVRSDNNVITGNRLINNDKGILLYYSSHNTFYDNIITNNEKQGILLANSNSEPRTWVDNYRCFVASSTSRKLVLG